MDDYKILEDKENFILKGKLDTCIGNLKKSKGGLVEYIDNKFSDLHDFISDKRNDLVEELEGIYEN